MATMNMQTMTLTDAAAKRVRELMEKRDEPSAGLRVGIRTGGCSGMAYTMEFAAENRTSFVWESTTTRG